MDEEIVLSDELWDYYVAVGEISAMIQNAYALAISGSEIVNDTNTYQGIAYDELFFFTAATVGHLQKLMMLYSAAETYLINTFQEKCEEDELLDWIFSHL